MFGLPATRVRDWIVGTSRTAILDTVNLPTPLRFRRSVTLRGEAFFCAAREFVQEALDRYKAKLGVSSCAVTWREVMSASAQHRVNQADTLRSVGHWMPSGVDNISQTTAFRKGAPIFAGCLTRSNAVHWSATEDRPQLPEECLVQMGLPVFQHLAEACGYTCAFHDEIASKSLPESLLRRVAGNTLHPAVLGALLLTCWGNLDVRCEGSSEAGNLDVRCEGSTSDVE